MFTNFIRTSVGAIFMFGKPFAGVMMIGLTLVVTIAPSDTRADTLTSLLGEQDFADGEAISELIISTAGVGEPSPFDGSFFGSDPGGTLGSFTYTHTFSLGSPAPTSASLTIGLLDHDSYSVSDDVIDILFDGIAQDDTPFLGISVAPATAEVVTIPVPLALLADGSLTVDVIATAPSPISLGNGIGVDFSNLTILTIIGSAVVPEPSTFGLAVLGLLSLGMTSRRRRRR